VTIFGKVGLTRIWPSNRADICYFRPKIWVILRYLSVRSGVAEAIIDDNTTDGSGAGPGGRTG